MQVGGLEDIDGIYYNGDGETKVGIDIGDNGADSQVNIQRLENVVKQLSSSDD